MEPVLVVNLALQFDRLHDWHEPSIRYHPRRKQLFSSTGGSHGGFLRRKLEMVEHEGLRGRQR